MCAFPNEISADSNCFPDVCECGGSGRGCAGAGLRFAQRVWRLAGQRRHQQERRCNRGRLRECSWCSRNTASSVSKKPTTCARDDGRKLAIKAAVFNDASGAYGAFTYYKTPAMLDEKIGGQAAR